MSKLVKMKNLSKKNKNVPSNSQPIRKLNLSSGSSSDLEFSSDFDANSVEPIYTNENIFIYFFGNVNVSLKTS